MGNSPAWNPDPSTLKPIVAAAGASSNWNPDPTTAKPLTPSASTPGAYQQSKGGPIYSANSNQFTDSKTSTLGDIMGTKSTGALMKRDGESDSQFLARAVAAGKQVTPEQVETETRSNAARTAPTAIAAFGAPAVLSEVVGGAADAASLAGKGIQAVRNALPAAATPDQIAKVAKILYHTGAGLSGIGGTAYLVYRELFGK